MLKSWNNCAANIPMSSPKRFWWQLAISVLSHIVAILSLYPAADLHTLFFLLLKQALTVWPGLALSSMVFLSHPRMLGLQACHHHTWLRILFVRSTSMLQTLAYLTSEWLPLHVTGVCFVQLFFRWTDTWGAMHTFKKLTGYFSGTPS